MKPVVPTEKTLKKYGLTKSSWRRLLLRGGCGCSVCGKLPDSGVLHIDHDHVKGWKKLPPKERALHVRGLLCWACNHWRVSRNTARTAEAVWLYLFRHQLRTQGGNIAQHVATGPTLPLVERRPEPPSSEPATGS